MECGRKFQAFLRLANVALTCGASPRVLSSDYKPYHRGLITLCAGIAALVLAGCAGTSIHVMAVVAGRYQPRN